MKINLSWFVSFALSFLNAFVAAPFQASSSVSTPKASLSNPKSKKVIDCSRRPDGFYRCAVSGKSEGVTSGVFQLLLWVNPVQPSGDGWYLQRGSSNGIRGIGKGGEWEGLIQLGNAQYPPHENDTIEIELTIVKVEEARQMLREEGVVVRPEPDGIHADKANEVRVHLR